MKLFKKIFLIVCMLSFECAIAGKDEPTQQLMMSSPVSTGQIVQVVLGLIVIIVLIFGSAFFIRRFGQFPNSSNAVMKIIAGMSLGPREKVVLLQVGENQLLVGVTQNSVKTLHVLSTPIIQDVNKNNGQPSFTDRLQAVLSSSRKSS